MLAERMNCRSGAEEHDLHLVNHMDRAVDQNVADDQLVSQSLHEPVHKFV